MKVSSTRQTFNCSLEKPKNSKADVLRTLILKGSVSLEDFPRLAGFRTRVSNLRLKHNIPMEVETIKGKNQFGNVVLYHQHILPVEQREFAINVYSQINA